jgi:hypothetical protein
VKPQPRPPAFTSVLLAKSTVVPKMSALVCSGVMLQLQRTR